MQCVRDALGQWVYPVHRLDRGTSGVLVLALTPEVAERLSLGGIKASGFGRMNGREGLRSCCNTKAVLDDRFGLHFANKLFPVGDADFDRIKGAVQVMYGSGLRRKLRGLRDIVGGLRRKRA